MANSPTNCTTPNGSIAFTSTRITAGPQTLNYKKDAVAASATVTVAADGSFTLSGLGKGIYSDFAIGITIATGSKELTDPAKPTVSITGATSVAVGATTNLSPTSGGTWVSNNTAATVTNGGVVTGVSVGSATFTFTQTSTGCFATSPAVTITTAPCIPTTNSTARLVWNGSVDTDWAKPCNWTPASVPTATNNVEIPAAPANQPSISTAALAKSVFISKSATLTISATGSLTINSSTDFIGDTDIFTSAFINEGTVQNNGQLTLGNIASVGNYGLWNAGTFNNNTGANINIDNSSSGGLNNFSGTFTNKATITIGGTANVGINGLISRSNFNNNAGANIYIDRSTSRGLFNAGGVFTNEAIITIGSVATVGSFGLYNDAPYNNNACAKFIIKSGSIGNLNAKTITNTGYVQVDGDLTNNGTFTNNGVLKYVTKSGNGTLTSASALSVIVNNNPTNTTIFTYGGTFNGVVNGIFKDEAATTAMSAGTFTAPNTFIPSVLTPGLQTLYAKITPGGGACNYVVPFAYTAATPVPTIASFPATACVGSPLVITGTNFTGATAVSIGGTAVSSFVLNSATQITATIATGNTGTISITTPNGVAVSSTSFTAKNVPIVPTIIGSTEICEGFSTTLSASSTFSSNQPLLVTTYQWTGGLTGSNLVVSPKTTQNYRVAAVIDGCSSDSSLVFTLTVNPKPAKPSITADNMTICKGNNSTLTGTCSSTTNIFRWSTPVLKNASGTTLPSSNTQIITEPGTYKGLCESNKGCLSEEMSITINQATDCNGQNFVTITPERPAICSGASITMTATGCTGSLSWVGGASTLTGISVSLSPAATTNYSVQCSTGGSGSFTLVVASNTLAVPSDVSTGKERFKAVTTLTSDKKVGVPTFTPGANVIYEAGNSIILLPGFVAEKWSTFKAEIKACN